MDVVTLVNRSSKTLQGTWDGRHYDLVPGKHQFGRLHAEKFKEQNPVMGSEDPQTLAMDYLIGIEENGDDCSPIEQSIDIEKWNRKKLNGPAVEIVRGKGGLFATERHSALPGDSNFVKP